MAHSSLEKGLLSSHSPEGSKLAVIQPGKVEGLTMFLEEINRISETTGEDRSGDWSGSGQGSTGMATTQGGATAVSARDHAIANLPAPARMQKDLEKHIRIEVKMLRKQARAITRLNKPGAAYHLNQLYSRIHHLNALLAEIFEASYEVLKRLFIRVFIDRQTIL